MQPRRERRLSAKRCNLAVELQKRFLRQILRFGGIRRHPQTQRIHPSLVLVIEHLERFCVPQLSPFNCLGFADVRALSLSWLGQVALSGRIHSDAA